MRIPDRLPCRWNLSIQKSIRQSKLWENIFARLCIIFFQIIQKSFIFQRLILIWILDYIEYYPITINLLGQPGFDPSYGNLICLATLMSSDRTKQICLWMTIYIYIWSNASSTEKDIDTRLTKAWTAIDRFSIIWKSDLIDKMKRSFFQEAVVSILLYGWTTWTLTKRLKKKLDGNYTIMLRAILNRSWQQHHTRYQLYGHLPPITKTIQVRRTRHAGHSWRSKDELIREVLLWTPAYGQAKAGRPARTYIQQLCEVMNDREKWRERVRDIRASGKTWGWMMMMINITIWILIIPWLIYIMIMII